MAEYVCPRGYKNDWHQYGRPGPELPESEKNGPQWPRCMICNDPMEVVRPKLVRTRAKLGA